MPRVGAATLWICVLGIGSRAEGQVRLPVEINQFGMMVVKVGTSGDSMGSFVIDLGAGTEVVSGRIAERVRLGPAGHFTHFAQPASVSMWNACA